MKSSFSCRKWQLLLCCFGKELTFLGGNEGISADSSHTPKTLQSDNCIFTCIPIYHTIQPSTWVNIPVPVSVWEMYLPKTRKFSSDFAALVSQGGTSKAERMGGFTGHEARTTRPRVEEAVFEGILGCP